MTARRSKSTNQERSTTAPALASPRLRGEGSACGRTSGAKRSGGEGAVPEEAPFACAAPLPETPPHPRLLRRLAAFGSPLPAGGERRGERFALRCANDDWRRANGTRRDLASPRLRGEGSACGRTSGAKRSGGEGAVPEEAPFADAAPLPETPPHPRLLRRLAAFGSPLPAGGERRGERFALRCANDDWRGANGTRRLSPLPACGERVRPAAERAERSEAGVRGRCRKRHPSPTLRLFRSRPLVSAQGRFCAMEATALRVGWPSNPKPGDVARTPSGNNRG